MPQDCSTRVIPSQRTPGDHSNHGRADRHEINSFSFNDAFADRCGNRCTRHSTEDVQYGGHADGLEWLQHSGGHNCSNRIRRIACLGEAVFGPPEEAVLQSQTLKDYLECYRSFYEYVLSSPLNLARYRLLYRQTIDNPKFVQIWGERDHRIIQHLTELLMKHAPSRVREELQALAWLIHAFIRGVYKLRFIMNHEEIKDLRHYFALVESLLAAVILRRDFKGET